MQDASTIEEGLARLESGLRQLKVQYDMFFAGSLPRQPFELRRQIETSIKRWTHASGTKYHHRFRFNALVARYNSMSELWGKTLRAREVGERPAPAVAERRDREDRVVATFRMRDPRQDEEVLRRLHGKFVEARERVGSGGGKLSFDKFAQKIAAQADRIRDRADCEHVELRVVHSGGKVLLKARPVR